MEADIERPAHGGNVGGHTGRRFVMRHENRLDVVITIRTKATLEFLARHTRLAEGVRRAVSAWGLSLVAARRELYSDTVTAIRVPDTVDARDVIRIAYDDYNASFGSGLGPLAGQVFRIGHLGDMNEGTCLTALSIAEMALHRAGVPVQLGSGVGAAQAHFAVGPNIRPSLRIAAE